MRSGVETKAAKEDTNAYALLVCPSVRLCAKIEVAVAVAIKIAMDPEANLDHD